MQADDACKVTAASAAGRRSPARGRANARRASSLLFLGDGKAGVVQQKPLVPCRSRSGFGAHGQEVLRCGRGGGYKAACAEHRRRRPPSPAIVFRTVALRMSSA